MNNLRKSRLEPGLLPPKGMEAEALDLDPVTAQPIAIALAPSRRRSSRSFSGPKASRIKRNR